jgi:hypothetical protein
MDHHSEESREMMIRLVRKIAHHLAEMVPTLREMDGPVEPWVQDKMSQAAEALESVSDYLIFSDQRDADMWESVRVAEQKLCDRGKNAAKAKYDVYPSAYANGYAVQVCKGQKPGLDGKKRRSWAKK